MGSKKAETYVTEFLATNDDDVLAPSGRSQDLLAGKTSMMSMLKNSAEIEIGNVITTMDSRQLVLSLPPTSSILTSPLLML